MDCYFLFSELKVGVSSEFLVEISMQFENSSLLNFFGCHLTIAIPVDNIVQQVIYVFDLGNSGDKNHNFTMGKHGNVGDRKRNFLLFGYEHVLLL